MPSGIGIRVRIRVDRLDTVAFLKLQSEDSVRILISQYIDNSCLISYAFLMYIGLRGLYVKASPWSISLYISTMVERKLFKTKPCALFKKGHCRRQTCSFAHGHAELRRFSKSFSGKYTLLISTCLCPNNK